MIKAAFQQRGAVPKLLLIAISMSVSACSVFGWRSPLMADAPSVTLAGQGAGGRARVVFIQTPGGGYHGRAVVRIADERGTVLGDSLPNTYFAAELPPGKHELFAWNTNMEIVSASRGSCTCFLRQCYFVAAMPAELLADRTYYVRIAFEDGDADGMIGTDHLDFQPLSPVLAEWPSALFRQLRPTAVDAPQVAAKSGALASEYRSSFLCVGRRRMQEGLYWDAKKSTLFPSDGAVSALDRGPRTEPAP